MTKYITATEANQKFSRILRDVAAGATYTVTSRGKPVAEISAPKDEIKGQDLAGLLKFMDSRPVRVIGPWTREELYDR